MSESSTRIKLCVIDVDGTLTDGMMTFDHQGNVSKGYHTRDVTALWLLLEAGIDVLVLTGSNHECDVHRFNFLANATGVFDPRPVRPLKEVLAQGVHDKVAYLEQLMKERGLSWDEIAYIGDAENDLAALMRAGWSACPNDAYEDVRAKVNMVMHYGGGKGAVREFADTIIRTTERIAWLDKLENTRKEKVKET